MLLIVRDVCVSPHELACSTVNVVRQCASRRLQAVINHCEPRPLVANCLINTQTGVCPCVWWGGRETVVEQCFIIIIIIRPLQLVLELLLTNN